jgi:hypothetical protein
MRFCHLINRVLVCKAREEPHIKIIDKIFLAKAKTEFIVTVLHQYD